MIQGTTSAGFAYEIDERRITADYRFTRALTRLKKASDDEANAAFDALVSQILTDEQQDALIEALLNSTGHATAQDVSAQLAEIIRAAAEQSKDAKN